MRELGKEYDFLKEYNIAGLVVAGSRAHGIANTDSDLDIRGIVFNTKRDILLGNMYKVYDDSNTDTVLFSHGKFLEMLKKSNMNMLELLGTSQDQWLETSWFMEKIIKNLDKILSKDCVNTFTGYANSQMRIIDKKMDSITDEKHLNYLANTLNKASKSFKEKYSSYKDIDISEKNDKLWVRANFDMPLKEVIAISSMLDSMIKQSEKSERSSTKLPLKVMAKAQANVIYSYMFLLDILRDNGLNTYRDSEEIKLLRSIRNQDFIKDSKPTKEFYDLLSDYKERVESEKDNTKLRERPDCELLDNILIETNERIISETNK